ncbi:hypothetical protein [Marinobacter sp.]|uniref:hypothetical protein n=1 Tax=Marinobacter sp. TaxID=50741 RepID=UPI0035C704D9
MESTVSAFEIEENGLSVVLTNAIEDQRAVVEYLAAEHDRAQVTWRAAIDKDYASVYVGLLSEKVQKLNENQFRAMRVLGLLEAAREREAGGVA